MYHAMRVVVVRWMRGRPARFGNGTGCALIHVDGRAARRAQIEEARLLLTVRAVVESCHHLATRIARPF